MLSGSLGLEDVLQEVMGLSSFLLRLEVRHSRGVGRINVKIESRITRFFSQR